MDERPELLLSIDFEDWHQLVHRRLGLPDWDRPYDALEHETAALLDLLDELVEDVSGRRPVSYRAPAFSINRRTPWAYEVLVEAGFRYDSSQYDSPRVPDRLGGIPDGPYRLTLGSSDLWELPVSTWGPLPIGGGSYWRVLPPRLIEAGLRDFSVLYFHPYEFDPR